MKKGFTLIELLAVIIILAVIALIATPAVLNVIDNAKKDADKNSAYGLIDGAKLYYTEQLLKNSGSFAGYECSFNNGTGCDYLQISGNKPTTGTISISENGMVNGKVAFNENEFYICNSKVLEEESSECNFIEYEKIYGINETGVITGFKTEEEVSALEVIMPVVNAASLTKEAEEYIKDGKITIPETINNIEVTGIADNAFSSYEITEVTLLSSKVLTLGTNALPTTLTKLRVNSCNVNSYSLNVEIEGIGPECEVKGPPKCIRGAESETPEELISGDLFYCDVNGDGEYNATNERFYYVSDLYNTTKQEFDDKYAVLIYYSNYGGQTAYSKYSYNGPSIAKTVLPTTDVWSNVSLSNPIRAIITSDGGTQSAGVDLPTDFSYEGYAARLLTYQEAVAACGEGTTTATNYVYKNCPYLLVNVRTSGHYGYYLETPDTTRSTHAWIVYDQVGTNAYRRLNPMNVGSGYGYSKVRPVIEVLKTDIEY